jgi:hypothetical protein
MNDVAGIANSGTYGGLVLSAASTEGVADTAAVAVAANIDDGAPLAPAIGDTGVTCKGGIPGVICPVGGAHVTTVPGIVGSEVNGTGAKVVSGAAWVNAENGLGPLSGEDRIVPGVDGRLMAVPPTVETCARQTRTPVNRVIAVISKRRIANSFPRQDLARPRLAHRTHRYLAAVGQVDHRVENDTVARPDAIVRFDLGAKVTRDGDLLKAGDAVLDHRDVEAILIEYDGVSRDDHRWRLARNM